MEREKMIKTAKALDKLFRILQRIIIICAAVSVVVIGIFTVINAIGLNSTIGTDFHSVDIGPLTLELAEEVAPDNNAILIYAWTMAAAAIAIIAVGCYAIGIIRKILAPMTQGDPFHPVVGKEIRRLAFASLVIGIVQNIMGAAETLSMLHIFHLNTLLLDSQIQSVTANFRYDVSFIVVFFVLLLMSYIFHYGEELQKLSDETL